jgi:hypothetical protein
MRQADARLKASIIDGIAARLNDEDVGAPHVFENLKIDLAVAEAPEFRLAEGHFQMAANALRQRQIRGPRENFESVVVHDACAPAALVLGLHTSWPEITFNG